MSSRRLRNRLAVVAAAVLVTPLALFVSPVTAEEADASDITVTYVESARWDTGYTGEFTVHNASGTDLTDWDIEFELPEGSQIHELWNAALDGTAEDGYTVTPPHWGAVVPAGGTYEFGYNGIHTDGNSHLVDCTVNGSPCAGEPGEGPQHDSLNVAYFTQWGVEERDYHVRDLIESGAAEQLTHINYAFGNVGADGECFMTNEPEEGDAEADYGRATPAEESVDGTADGPDQPLRGNFNQLRKLKEQYPHLDISVSLGGWNWSKHFSDAVLTPESRENLVSSCVDLYLKGDLPEIDGAGGEGVGYGIFDGIDLDWEWPGSEGNPHNVVRPEDRENFTALVQEFRDQLDELGDETGRHFELSSFMPAGAWRVDAGYELDEIMPNFDFITVQGYDYNGSWDESTNHQSNLVADPDSPGYPDEVITTEGNVEAYLERGVDPEKIVLGVPFYSQGWTGVEPGPEGDGLFQPAEGPAPGSFEDGTEDWKVLKELSGFDLYRDDDLGTAWLYDGETFWTYDDEVSMTQKTDWANENGLGGVMIWSIDGDDSEGSLLTAIDAALGR